MKAAAAHARILRKRCAARLDAARIATPALMQRTSRLLRRKTARASRIAPSQLPPHTHMSMRQAGPAIATMLALSFTAAMMLSERVTTRSETLEPGSAQASPTSWAELSGRHVQAWPHRL
jgi:hypothetical protein